MNLDLATFKHNLLISNHFTILLSSETSDVLRELTSIRLPNDSNVEFNVVSSAYIMKLNLLVAFVISLVNILNNNGPRIDPCGTPLVISSIPEVV